jgi:hypothetical protein
MAHAGAQTGGGPRACRVAGGLEPARGEGAGGARRRGGTPTVPALTGALDYARTIPTTTTIDPNLVNVQIAVGGGMTVNVGRVMSMAECAASGGWFYDNPTTPTQIILCDQSCNPLKMAAGSRVQVLYGCPWVPPK